MEEGDESCRLHVLFIMTEDFRQRFLYLNFVFGVTLERTDHIPHVTAGIDEIRDMVIGPPFWGNGQELGTVEGDGLLACVHLKRIVMICLGEEQMFHGQLIMGDSKVFQYHAETRILFYISIG